LQIKRATNSLKDPHTEYTINTDTEIEEGTDENENSTFILLSLATYPTQGNHNQQVNVTR